MLKNNNLIFCKFLINFVFRVLSAFRVPCAFRVRVPKTMSISRIVWLGTLIDSGSVLEVRLNLYTGLTKSTFNIFDETHLLFRNVVLSYKCIQRDIILIVFLSPSQFWSYIIFHDFPIFVPLITLPTDPVVLA